MKSNAEKLLDQLARLTESETVVTDGVNDAYQLAGLVSCELDEEYEKVDWLRAELAEAVCQAAIGRRAVELLRTHQHYLGENAGEVVTAWCVECDSTGGCSDGCELAATLRDAEQAGMGVKS